MKKNSVQMLTRMALYVALYVAVDLFSSRFITMANGGSLGLSAIVLLMASFDLGVKKSLIVIVLSMVVSFLYTPVYFVRIDQYLLEYFVAYMVYGFASAITFKKKGFTAIDLAGGALVTNLIRFFCHIVAGVLYWETPWAASYTYNSTYMVPTTIACVVLLPILYRALKSKMS